MLLQALDLLTTLIWATMLCWLSIKGADLAAALRWRIIPVVVILWTVMGMFLRWRSDDGTRRHPLMAALARQTAERQASVYHAIEQVIGVSMLDYQGRAEPLRIGGDVLVDPLLGGVGYRREQDDDALVVDQ
jgi:hypothetical protein